MARREDCRTKKVSVPRLYSEAANDTAGFSTWQLKTVSKCGTSSPKLVVYSYQWNSAAVFPHGNAQVPF